MSSSLSSLPSVRVTVSSDGAFHSERTHRRSRKRTYTYFDTVRAGCNPSGKTVFLGCECDALSALRRQYTGDGSHNGVAFTRQRRCSY